MQKQHDKKSVRIRTTRVKPPREKTDRKKSRFLFAYLKFKGNVSKACAYAGMKRNLYYEMIKADPAFKQACIDVEQYACDEIETELVKQIKSKKGSAALTIFYLVNRRPEKWQNVQKVENKFDEGQVAKVDRLLSKAAKLIGGADK